jgi:transposase
MKQPARISNGQTTAKPAAARAISTPTAGAQELVGTALREVRQGGRSDRAEPDRSGQAGQPAPADHRTARRAIGPVPSAANVNEGTLLERLVDAIPPLRQPHRRPGRPRRRPAKLHADKAYDSRKNRDALHRRHILPRIARRLIDSSTRLGRHRWVAERTFAWLHRNRRLRVRYERDDALHQAFLSLAAALILLAVASSTFVIEVAPPAAGPHDDVHADTNCDQSYDQPEPGRRRGP